MRIFTCLLLYLSTSIASAQIAVECRGDGQAVYLIGGGPAFTTWNLEPIQQQLEDEFRLCRWDMRGIGENADLEINSDKTLLAQWLQDMADVLPAEPVILWGHSWGALQVLLFAKYHPQRVRSLVLNNPVDPDLNSLEHIEIKRYVHPYVEAQLGIDDIDTVAEQRHRLRSKIASYFSDAKLGWAYSEGFDINDSNNELNVRIWQEYRDMRLSTVDIELLSDKISRMIYCEHDVLMPENLEYYSALVTAERNVVIKKCAHFPWVETPAEYYDILRQAFRQ